MTDAAALPGRMNKQISEKPHTRTFDASAEANDFRAFERDDQITRAELVNVQRHRNAAR